MHIHLWWEIPNSKYHSENLEIDRIILIWISKKWLRLRTNDGLLKNTVLNLRGPWNVGSASSNWETDSFSARTMLFLVILLGNIKAKLRLTQKVLPAPLLPQSTWSFLQKRCYFQSKNPLGRPKHRREYTAEMGHKHIVACCLQAWISELERTPIARKRLRQTRLRGNVNNRPLPRKWKLNSGVSAVTNTLVAVVSTERDWSVQDILYPVSKGLF
jgi:hypothetical protein